MSRILAVEAALPAHRYSQSALAEALIPLVGADAQVGRKLRRIHGNCGVEHRHVALEIERYAGLADFGAANDAFIDAAVELGTAAACGALDRAGLRPDDVDFVVSTTVTGLAVPSLEARIGERIGLRGDVVRLPMIGLGCMGGAAGIARANDLVAGRPNAIALLLAVELCSLTVQRDDVSPANLVASGLFGDGAGAVVVAGDSARGGGRAAREPNGAHEPNEAVESNEALGPSVVASASRLYPDTRDVMGWHVESSGLRVVLGAEVPALVRGNVGPDVADFLAHNDLAVGDVEWWVCHPGGPKVIDALVDALGIDRQHLALTIDSLRRVGNLSSASVVHILRDTLDVRRPRPGSHGVMLAMGPGFSLEVVLLRMPDE